MYEHKLSLLSWLILPLIGVWLATNYLIGLRHQVNWTANTALVQMPQQVLGTQTLDWQKSGAVTLWFDDAWYSQYEYGSPALLKRGYKGALAIATDLIGQPNYMTWPQVENLKKQGWETTAHSVTHECDPEILDPERSASESANSQLILREKNLQADIYVTPCGVTNEYLIKDVRERYMALRSSDSGINSIPIDDPYSLRVVVLQNSTTITDIEKWLMDAKDQKAWVIFVLHQIGFGTNQYEITPDFFDQLLNVITASDLPVVRPSQTLNI